MKILVLSDVHSNIYALEAIHAREKDSDIIVCAGDLVDYGPYPKEVVDWVRSHGVMCVQGNHDVDVIHAYRHCEDLWERRGQSYYWVHHNARRLEESDIAFLDTLPTHRVFEADGCTYIMRHMYMGYKEIASLPQFETFWKGLEGPETAHKKRIILGHTHRRGIHYLGMTQLWLNPGSVSYRRPDDPSKEAHYITIEDGQIIPKALEYDRRPLLEEVLQEDMFEREVRVAMEFFG